MRPRCALGLVAAAAFALAACGDDTLRIALAISDGPVQACMSAAPPAAPSCGDVRMPCDAVLDLRVVRPRAPEQPFAPLCEPIPRNASGDLCALEQIDLPAHDLPRETLEVQVLIWPRAAVAEDLATGALDCGVIDGQRAAVGFGIEGFPEEVAPTPALGGRAFYHPGDAQTVVTLGCSDLSALARPSCAGPIALRAGVSELDRPSSPVTGVSLNELVVAVGEPRYDVGRGEHVWQPIQTLEPQSVPPGEAPKWSGAVDALDTQGTLCVQVNGGLGTSSAVRCSRIDPETRLFDLMGTWLPASRLAKIVAGLGLGAAPQAGMTIGILIDDGGQPVKSYRIETIPSTGIVYLDEDDQVASGATVTTSSGLFVSLDAPYDSDFRAFMDAQVSAQVSASGIGGRVSNRVTVTVLRLGQ